MVASKQHPASGRATVTGQRIGERELLIMISAVMALMALGLDMMLPAFDEMRTAYDLGEGSNRVGQVITIFFAGLAVAQLFYGPLADRFGRKPILYVGMTIYLAGAVGSALAPTFEVLLVSRFVWGVGAAGSRVVAVAIIRDQFEGTAMAKAMSQIMAVFILVPVFAPAIGAGIIVVAPWQFVFWFCGLLVVLLALWTRRLRETLNPADQQTLSVGRSLRSYRDIARTPVTAGYTIATMFIQGVFTAYLASSELIIGEIYDRGSQFPFIFGVIAIGFGAGALLNGWLVGRWGIERLITRAFVVLLGLSVLLVAIAVAGNGTPSFWLFIPVLGCCLSNFMFLMPNLNTAALGPVGHIAGSASALTGASRVGAGAVLGTLVGTQVKTSVTGFAVSVLVLCSAAAITVMVVRARQRSVL